MADHTLSKLRQKLKLSGEEIERITEKMRHETRTYGGLASSSAFMAEHEIDLRRTRIREAEIRAEIEELTKKITGGD